MGQKVIRCIDSKMFSRLQPTHADRRYVPPPPSPTYVGDTRFAPLLVSQAAARPLYSTVREYNKLFFPPAVLHLFGVWRLSYVSLTGILVLKPATVIL